MGFGKSTLYSILPPGTRYRELWLPELINNYATLPSSIARGHPLTFTGARHGTTADGVHFTGANDSNINCGAIHNAATELWISFRFKLDQPYTPGLGDQWIMGKYIHGNDFFTVRLADNGYLYWRSRTTGTDRFTLGVYRAVWTTGWHHVIFSLSSTVGARMVVDGAEYTDPNTSPGVNGGDLVFGDRDDPGAGSGFKGVIADIFVGTDDLTTNEEADLRSGIPPADVVNEWLLDEGRGVTAYDRGSGADNGTLDTTATWAWGRVRQPVISLDSINDHAQSSAGVDISGDLTFVWVAKMKSTYDGLSGTNRTPVYMRVGGTDLFFIYFRQPSDDIRWYVNGGAVPDFVIYTGKPAIDDYQIWIGTITAAGIIRLFINGALIGTTTGVGAIAGGVATAYIGSTDGPASWDISKPLLVGLIDGAFTEKQARTFSKELNGILGLGLAI